MMEIEKKLDELAELYAQRDLSEMDKQKLIDEVMTDEIKARIAEINAEFAGKTEAVASKIETLENEIKQDVIANGASVKGKFINAVYSKPRVTWDNKGLDGLMVAVPQLAQFRKEGNPSVSLRKI